jgi:hypothetical protein
LLGRPIVEFAGVKLGGTSKRIDGESLQHPLIATRLVRGNNPFASNSPYP